MIIDRLPLRFTEVKPGAAIFVCGDAWSDLERQPFLLGYGAQVIGGVVVFIRSGCRNALRNAWEM